METAFRLKPVIRITGLNGNVNASRETAARDAVAGPQRNSSRRSEFHHEFDVVAEWEREVADDASVG